MTATENLIKFCRELVHHRIHHGRPLKEIEFELERLLLAIDEDRTGPVHSDFPSDKYVEL